MKRRLLPSLAVTVLVAASWAIVAWACDHEKTTTAQAASAKGASCSPAAAAQCTPEQMAQCKAHGMKNTAVTASSSSCGSKASAVMASGSSCGVKNKAAMASNGRCAGMMGAVFASSPGAGAAHCAGKTAATASAGCAHDKGASTTSYDAVAAGAGCSSHSSSQTALGGGHGCDACADMSNCEDQLRSIGTQIQAVPLKNGVMFVYTASATSGVRAVQAAMTRRSDRLTAITASGDRATLCPECKSLRGAIASGKLSREMVNIDGGCLTLMTSNDPAMVSKLKAMAGVTAARTKS